MRKNSAPATAAALHCGAVGFTSPLSRAHDHRMPPAATERTPAIRNGGIDSTPKRIARKVEPQMIQVAAYAPSSFARSGLAPVMVSLTC